MLLRYQLRVLWLTESTLNRPKINLTVGPSCLSCSTADRHCYQNHDIKIPYRGWSMILTVCCCSLFIHIQCTCTEHPDHTCGPEAVSQSEYALDRNLYERLKVHRTVKSRFFNGWPWCGWSIYKFGVKKKHIVGKLASDTKTLVNEYTWRTRHRYERIWFATA